MWFSWHHQPWAANKQWLSCTAAIFSEAAGKVCKLSCSVPTHTCTNTHIFAAKWFCHSIVTKFSSCDFLINFFLCTWPGSCVFSAPHFSISDIWKPPFKQGLMFNTPWNVDSTRSCAAQLSYTLNSFFHLTVQNFIVFFIRSGGVLVHHVQKGSAPGYILLMPKSVLLPLSFIIWERLKKGRWRGRLYFLLAWDFIFY